MLEHADEGCEDVAGEVDVRGGELPAVAFGTERRGGAAEIGDETRRRVAVEVAGVDLGERLPDDGSDPEVHLGDESTEAARERRPFAAPLRDERFLGDGVEIVHGALLPVRGNDCAHASSRRGRSYGDDDMGGHGADRRMQRQGGDAGAIIVTKR